MHGVSVISGPDGLIVTESDGYSFLFRFEEGTVEGVDTGRRRISKGSRGGQKEKTFLPSQDG